jgi:glyceraldehyde 3-phosphate dehydrogenase
LRAAHERGADIEVVAVNDLVDAHTLAHLLQYDSVFGRFPAKVVVAGDGIDIGAHRVRTFAETDPQTLPWRELGVDVVIESTGRFRTRAAAAEHLDAGARKVIISAPAKGDQPADVTVVLGVNFDDVYDPDAHHIISNASHDNCLASRRCSTRRSDQHGLMTTIHAYTDQHLLDGPHTDLRRQRAAAQHHPHPTGAAKALGLVIPELDGRPNETPYECQRPPGRWST